MLVVDASVIEPPSSTRAIDTEADDLLALPVEVAPTEALLPRVWELRHNVTPYDASYVALAEALGCTLLSADLRVGRAPGVRCRIESP